MIWKFPDLATLRLALASGIVPPHVAAAPASAVVDEAGQAWIEAAEILPRRAQTELKRLRVESVRRVGRGERREICCWAALLPLVIDTRPLERPEQKPVLFEVNGIDQLKELIHEMLRLGNDRQSYRWLESTRNGAKSSRALLRVVNPPYYSLLRSHDRRRPDAPRAFIERTANIWIELGYTHPFAADLHAPPGQLVLLAAPSTWEVLDEAPFEDVYRAIEFHLSAAPTIWQPSALPGQLRVQPTLRASASTEPADFWVIREDPIVELNQYVQHCKEDDLPRLAFAVGTNDGRTTIVIRARRGNWGSPVVTGLKADSYRAYPQLPNLYLPSGTAIHPPLRRDRVRELFAADPAQITWLAGTGKGGEFVPHSLPESAFRPLNEWVEYVLDQDRVALVEWMQAMKFEFEGFLCADETPASVRKSPPRARAHPRPRAPASIPSVPPAPVPLEEPVTEVADSPQDVPGIVEAPREPDAQQRRLRELEAQFLAVGGGLDAPARQQLWPALAEAYGAAGERAEASLCWHNALWLQERPPIRWAEQLVRVEAEAAVRHHAATGASGPCWCARAVTAPRVLNAVALDGLLSKPEPATADVRALGAYLIWAAGAAPPPAVVLERLQPLHRFLEAHERLLPVRAVWLAWHHLVALGGGDSLALTRARDRLLDRLYQTGLQLDHDLPRFLRVAGADGAARLRGSWEWLRGLCDRARSWSARLEKEADQGSTTPPTRMTGAYLDLIFAFGLARVGDRDGCEALVQRARGALGQAEDRHQHLLEGFCYRIEQALDGRPHAGPLPAEWLQRLAHWQGTNGQAGKRYPIDALRSASRVLEPDQVIEAYWQNIPRSNILDQRLAQLADVADHDRLLREITEIWQMAAEPTFEVEHRAAALKAILERCAPLGEAACSRFLGEVVPLYDAVHEVSLRMRARADQRSRNRLASVNQFRVGLLERGLFLAAHFDRAELIAPLVERFRSLLTDPEAGKNVEGFDASLAEFFRSLRRLGLRPEIELLFQAIVNGVLGGRPLEAVAAGSGAGLALALGKLLHVAAGWYYVGRDADARRVLQMSEQVLYRTMPRDVADGPPTRLSAIDKTRLARTYVHTLAQAAPDVAQQGLEDLFLRLGDIHDTYTTASHYSRLHLLVAEAVVLAVTGEERGISAAARRWLDEDEHLVRQRLHRDVRLAMGDSR